MKVFGVVLDDHGEVSEALGCAYLSKTEPMLIPSLKIKGSLIGRHYRPFVVMNIMWNNVAYNVHFLVDTGSPFILHRRYVK
jgi:hypothetical protein